MSTSHLRVNYQGGVVRLTLDRAHKRNALTRATLQELLQALRNSARDPDVRVIVLTAVGPVFCAGMDLAEMQEAAQSEHPQQIWQADSQLLRDVFVEILQAPKPTIAVLNGPVVAGGVGLVLACDLVLAGEDCLFSLPEPKRGITASLVTQLLVYRAGAGIASFALLSGETFSAQMGLRWGLFHDVVATEELLPRSEALISTILTASPSALAKTKLDLLAAAGSGLIDKLDAAVKESAAARETEAAREGLAAYLEKRAPNWLMDHSSPNG